MKYAFNCLEGFKGIQKELSPFGLVSGVEIGQQFNEPPHSNPPTIRDAWPMSSAECIMSPRNLKLQGGRDQVVKTNKG